MQCDKERLVENRTEDTYRLVLWRLRPQILSNLLKIYIFLKLLGGCQVFLVKGSCIQGHRLTLQKKYTKKNKNCHASGKWMSKASERRVSGLILHMAVWHGGFIIFWSRGIWESHNRRINWLEKTERGLAHEAFPPTCLLSPHKGVVMTVLHCYRCRYIADGSTTVFVSLPCICWHSKLVISSNHTGVLGDNRRGQMSQTHAHLSQIHSGEGVDGHGELSQ